jgi:hypothetical protein
MLRLRPAFVGARFEPSGSVGHLVLRNHLEHPVGTLRLGPGDDMVFNAQSLTTANDPCRQEMVGLQTDTFGEPGPSWTRCTSRSRLEFSPNLWGTRVYDGLGATTSW